MTFLVLDVRIPVAISFDIFCVFVVRLGAHRFNMIES